MFHRVKSETPESPEEQVKEMEKASNDAHDAADKAEAEAETAEEQADLTSTTQIEDSKDMTDKDTPEEKTQEEAATPAPTSFSYQRTPAAAAPSSYPGSSSFGSGGYSAPAREGKQASSSSDRRLTIGSGITMSGEIESCDYLLVEGTVEAALKGANMLDIAESGTFYGTVEIDEANIAGRFEGDITVHGRLTISATGTVTGTVAYKELEIEAGAVIDGKLTPLSAVSATKSSPKNEDSASKSALKSKIPSKPKAMEVQKPEPANNDGGLFSKAAAE